MTIQAQRRPAVGWAATLIAIGVALTPALAATQSPLHPPGWPLVWAGLLGLLIGADGAAEMPSHRRALVAARALAHATAWALGAILLIAAAGAALPPGGLLIQDLIALVQRARGIPLPEPRSATFLAESSARLLNELGAAPSAGERGARLLLATIGVTLTWCGALVLGRAVGGSAQLLPRTLPLLLALALIALPGGEGGWPLTLGMLLALLFVAIGGFARREQLWDKRGTDYSEELSRDTGMWAVLVSIVALLAAWVLPLWPGNPLAHALQSLGGPPSGIAALESGTERRRFEDTPAEIGLSTLPSLFLGMTLAQGPPGQPALRITVSTTLPESTFLHYWRMRVFDQYSGTSWWATAHVGPQEPSPLVANFPGAVIQDVEDQRPDRQLLVGLPDIISTDIPVRAERFQDGGLAALAGNPPEVRYRLLSRLQDFAPPPARDTSPPDMSRYLDLPQNLPPRVRELALAVAAGAPDSYTRALRLETYLRELPYSYQVMPLPSDGDAVDQFLFEMRSGYCTYYASSMVVMARSLGIPARLATGYSTGERTPDGVYIVREADAHAWPELYINERWTPFEPTPIRPLPARDAERPPMTESAAAKPDAEPVPVAWRIGAGLAGAAALALGAVLLLRRRRMAQLDPLSQAVAVIEHTGERMGLDWLPGATLREYGEEVAAHTRATAAPVDTLVGLVERGRYSGRELEPHEWDRLGQAVTQLQAAADQDDERESE